MYTGTRLSRYHAWTTAADWSEHGASCACVLMRSGLHLAVNWPLTILKQASLSKRLQLSASLEEKPWQTGISCRGERALTMPEEGLQELDFGRPLVEWVFSSYSQR